MTREEAVQRIVRDIMDRRTGASGTAVFVDPIVLRRIVERSLDAVEPTRKTDDSENVY